jgi:hypothetical protein
VCGAENGLKSNIQKFSSNGLDLAELKPKQVDHRQIPTDLTPNELRVTSTRVLRHKKNIKNGNTSKQKNATPQSVPPPPKNKPAALELPYQAKRSSQNQRIGIPCVRLLRNTGKIIGQNTNE